MLLKPIRIYWSMMGFSKDVSSLSLVCLARNVDSLEDDDTSLDDVLLDSES